VSLLSSYRAPNQGTLSYRKTASFETSHDVYRIQGHDKTGTMRSYNRCRAILEKYIYVYISSRVGLHIGLHTVGRNVITVTETSRDPSHASACTELACTHALLHAKWLTQNLV